MKKTKILLLLLLVVVVFTGGSYLIFQKLSKKSPEVQAPLTGYPYSIPRKSDSELKIIKEEFVKNNEYKLKPENIDINPYTGMIISARVPLQSATSLPNREESKNIALRFLDKNKSFLGLDKIDKPIELKDVFEFEQKMNETFGSDGGASTFYFTMETMPRYKGIYVGSPFYNAGAFWQLDNLVDVSFVSDMNTIYVGLYQWKYYPQFTSASPPVPLTPKIDEKIAIQSLYGYKVEFEYPTMVPTKKTVILGKNTHNFSMKSLIILPTPAEKTFKDTLEFRLTYQIGISEKALPPRGTAGEIYLAYVDAIKGKVVKVDINSEKFHDYFPSGEIY